MSCPYFFPTDRCPEPLWPHPERLPLGGGFSGTCTAPGHDGFSPAGELLHDCNLGYANCARLPADRASDAVRFSIRRDPQGLLAIHYLSEGAHAPVSHGVLIFDPAASQWRERHDDARLQRMAECCVESHSKE
jgi:hypothetical protein